MQAHLRPQQEGHLDPERLLHVGHCHVEPEGRGAPGRHAQRDAAPLQPGSRAGGVRSPCAERPTARSRDKLNLCAPAVSRGRQGGAAQTLLTLPAPVLNIAARHAGETRTPATPTAVGRTARAPRTLRAPPGFASRHDGRIRPREIEHGAGGGGESWRAALGETAEPPPGREAIWVARAGAPARGMDQAVTECRARTRLLVGARAAPE
eukprot:15485446-Alexandrium_andersonii.AAC.2